VDHDIEQTNPLLQYLDNQTTGHTVDQLHTANSHLVGALLEMIAKQCPQLAAETRAAIDRAADFAERR
jgi:hypothetical protein